MSQIEQKHHLIRMKIIGDRPAVGNRLENFFLDEYTYASLLANTIRAEESIESNDVDLYYDKEGWAILLLYYIHCIDMLIDEWPNSITYIDVIEYNRLLVLDSKTELKVKRFSPYHDMPLANDIDVCYFTIQAIKIIRTILDMECNIDYLKAEYLKVRNLEQKCKYSVTDRTKKFIQKQNGTYKPKYSKTKKDKVCEAY